MIEIGAAKYISRGQEAFAWNDCIIDITQLDLGTWHESVDGG